jgi:hypothetical protein
MRSEQRFQQILTIVGGFLMPFGLAVIGIGWYGAAHTGYVFEQVPYLVSGGLFGLGLTICGALIFFSSWLARLVQLQRQQAELTKRLLEHMAVKENSSTQLMPMRNPLSDVASPEPDDADRGKRRGHNDQPDKRSEGQITARQSGQVGEGRHVHHPLVEPQ